MNIGKTNKKLIFDMSSFLDAAGEQKEVPELD